MRTPVSCSWNQRSKLLAKTGLKPSPLSSTHLNSPKLLTHKQLLRKIHPSALNFRYPLVKKNVRVFSWILWAFSVKWNCLIKPRKSSHALSLNSQTLLRRFVLCWPNLTWPLRWATQRRPSTCWKKFNPPIEALCKQRKSKLKSTWTRSKIATITLAVTWRSLMPSHQLKTLRWSHRPLWISKNLRKPSNIMKEPLSANPRTSA